MAVFFRFIPLLTIPFFCDKQFFKICHCIRVFHVANMLKTKSRLDATGCMDHKWPSPWLYLVGHLIQQRPQGPDIAFKRDRRGWWWWGQRHPMFFEASIMGLWTWPWTGRCLVASQKAKWLAASMLSHTYNSTICICINCLCICINCLCICINCFCICVWLRRKKPNDTQHPCWVRLRWPTKQTRQWKGNKLNLLTLKLVKNWTQCLE